MKSKQKLMVKIINRTLCFFRQKLMKRQLKNLYHNKQGYNQSIISINQVFYNLFSILYFYSQTKIFIMSKQTEVYLFDQSKKFIQHLEWPEIHAEIKSTRSYKSAYELINNYHTKIQTLLTTDLHHPQILFKRTEHKKIISTLKFSIENIVNDLNLLDMETIGNCIGFVFNRLCDCMQSYYKNIEICVSRLSEQSLINHQKYIHQSKCSQCQQNIHKNKIQSLMSTMTLGSNNSCHQITNLANQINIMASQSKEDEQLNSKIEDMLQKKELILGSKNIRINNIYQEIMEYLENIPQTTISLSKEMGGNQSSTVLCKLSGLDPQSASNFGEEIQRNLSDMLKNPIQNLIRRLLLFSKNLYNKKKAFETSSTQTLLIKDQQTIKILQKQNQGLKKQCQGIKQQKKDIEKQVFMLRQANQKGQIRISEITTQKQFLHERLNKLNAQFMIVKLKLEITENHKKEMGEKLVKDYTNDRSIFMKTIKQLENKLEAADNQLNKMKKLVQGNFTTAQTQTTSQNHHRLTIVQKKSLVENSSGKVIQLLGIQSRKNIMIKNNETGKKQQISEQQKQQKNQDKNQQTNNIKIVDDQILIEGKNVRDRFRKSKLPFNVNLGIQKNEKIKKSHRKRQSIIDKIEQISFKGQSIYKININLKQSNTKLSAQHSDRQSDFKKQVSCKSIYKQLSIQQSKKKIRRFPSNFHLHSRLRPQQSKNLPVSSCSSQRENLSQINRSDKKELIIEGINYQADDICLEPIGQKEMFLQRLGRKYSLLKQCGLVSKIDQLCHLGKDILRTKQQMFANVLKQRNNEQGQAITTLSIKSGIQLTDIKTIRQLDVQKNKIEGQKESFNLQKENIKEENQIFQKNAEQFSSSQFIQKEEVINAFGSLQNALYFQQNKGIWLELQSFIMVDNIFMSLCDKIQVFLVELAKNRPSAYRQCSQILTRPYHFYHKKNQKESGVKNIQRRNQKHGKNYEQILSNPHQLGFTFLKLLRYHKISHKKCSHIESFLKKLGLSL